MTVLLLLVQISTIVSCIFLILMNSLSNTITFNNNTHADVDHKYQTTFAHAPYASYIWVLIYISLIFYCMYQALPKFRISGGFVGRVGIVASFNFILTGVWSVVYDYESMVISVIIMLFILATLIYVYIALGIGEDIGFLPLTKALRCCSWLKQENYEKLNDEEEGEGQSLFAEGEDDSIKAIMAQYWCLFFPWSVYLGWISMTTISNFAVMFVYYGYTGASTAWSIVMQVFVTVLGLLMLITAADVAYALTIIWGLVAIYIEQPDTQVQTAAIALSGILGAATALVLLWRVYKLVVWLKEQRWTPRGHTVE